MWGGGEIFLSAAAKRCLPRLSAHQAGRRYHGTAPSNLPCEATATNDDSFPEPHQEGALDNTPVNTPQKATTATDISPLGFHREVILGDLSASSDKVSSNLCHNTPAAENEVAYDRHEGNASSRAPGPLSCGLHPCAAAA